MTEQEREELAHKLAAINVAVLFVGFIIGAVLANLGLI